MNRNSVGTDRSSYYNSMRILKDKYESYLSKIYECYLTLLSIIINSLSNKTQEINILYY